MEAMIPRHIPLIKKVLNWIENDRIEIRDADGIWGRDTYETPILIRQQLKNLEAKILCIGPAGENLVRFANVMTGIKNSGGRTGMGCVMGSKNLKAISVIGTGGITVHDPKALINRRLSQMDSYGFDLDNLETASPSEFHGPPGQAVIWEMIPFKKSIL